MAVKRRGSLMAVCTSRAGRSGPRPRASHRAEKPMRQPRRQPVATRAHRCRHRYRPGLETPELADSRFMYHHAMSDRVSSDNVSLPELLGAYASGLYAIENAGPPPFLTWEYVSRRMFLPLEQAVLPKRAVRMLESGRFRATRDLAFDAVVESCARPRRPGAREWLGPLLRATYTSLADAGMARSYEIWEGDRLVAGEFGVLIGRVYFVESGFHTVSGTGNASIVHAIRDLVNDGFTLYDMQQPNHYMGQFGAEVLPGDDFLPVLRAHLRPAGEVQIVHPSAGLELHRPPGNQT